MRKIAFAAVAVTIGLAAAPAQAALVITIVQSGANVTTTASGSFDLSGVTADGSNNSISTVVKGNTAFFGSGVSSKVNSYRGLTGPTVFGPGTSSYTATSKTGSAFVLNSSYLGSPVVSFATSYVSGTALTSTSTYNNVTIAALGLTEGSYVFKSSNDTITFNIGKVTPAVPEPATWGQLLLGFGALGGGLRLRRRTRFAHA